ncbi:hypothetical protein O7621_08295 [Solwaraspora sp. WMMD937]|uniref:peptidoglycan-binding domain-containing protein n=1 Tax=Solwaraspora sp. WMMD937 TaxID=3016090 RepID=UPI00249C460A|nr:hypothetical protein [Solwaraspora sp. WMMD937]WFE23288.1 hypothetical protein O7621_08295 [Solwaraspora sp. WMMD937]
MFRSAVTATLGGIIVAVIVLAFFLGGRLQSPEQVAADAAPPSPSLVTVAAQQRALVEPVVMRGQVRAGPSFHLLPPPGSVGDTSVVTKVLVKVGTSLVEGMVPLELSGEPMITLRLPFPLWRDLSGGMKGPDVVEVQKALGRLGHQLPVSGTWDASTQRAVSRLFSARGYDAQAGDSKAAEQLSAARTAVDDAEFAWETANTTGERIMEAQRRLDSAKDELRRAEILAGPVLPLRTVLQIDQAKRKITRVGVRLGSVLSDPRAPLLELDSADPYVSATVSAEQAKLVTPGQEGVVVDEIAGKKRLSRYLRWRQKWHLGRPVWRCG